MAEYEKFMNSIKEKSDLQKNNTEFNITNYLNLQKNLLEKPVKKK
jgi:hypothetical protein